MAITLTTASATIGATEYFLASASTVATYQTTDCVLQALIDFSTLTAGDQYAIKLYEKVDGTSVKLVYTAVVTGAQDQIFATPAFIVGNGWEVSVQKVTGTDRSIAWTLGKVA